MEFVTLAAAAALVWKIVSAFKLALAGDSRGFLTQSIVWVVGIGVAFLFRASDFAGAIPIGAVTLAQLNVAATIIVGFELGSVASVAYDFKKARDNSDSAKEPALWES